MSERRYCEMYSDEAIGMWPQDGPLKNRVKEWRVMSGYVVLINGCFDILHAGHIALLRYAKTRTWLDPEKMMLIVAVNSDNSVQKQDKGKDRPIVPFKQRVEAVRYIKGVDWVTGFEESTPQMLIEAIKPDLLIKGGDYEGDDIVGEDFVIKNGGCVLFAPMVEGISTTAIINRVRT